MTVRKDTIAKTDGKPDVNELREMALTHLGEMFDVHIVDILAILEDSEEQVAKFTFALQVDTSESQANVLSRLRYSKVTTDERTGMIGDPPDNLLEDPQQPPLGGTEGEIAKAKSPGPPKPKKGKKKKGGKKKAGSEPVKEPEPESVAE